MKIAWLVPCLFLMACAEPFSGEEQDSSVNPFVDAAITCIEGDTQCLMQSWRRCTKNKWVEQQQCPAAKVCSDVLGCVDCDPAANGKGCVGNAVHACSTTGKIGAKEKDCLGLVCMLGACRPPTCSVGSKLIYVIDDKYRLMSFDPTKESGKYFTLIKTITCPAGKSWPAWGGVGAATPFSMSIDRSARAWVLYTSGEIFWVSTKDGSCKRSPFQKGQSSFKLFGMGFVSDKAGSADEKVYVARAKLGSSTIQQMGYIDPATLKLTVVNSMDKTQNSGELSGTSKAELYGYFPGTTSSFVALLDKATGKATKKWNINVPGGQVAAWAFAHWGGKFYIFITTLQGLSEQRRVLRLDPVSGKTDIFMSSMPYRIVGAGVSTCAPVVD